MSLKQRIAEMAEKHLADKECTCDSDYDNCPHNHEEYDYVKGALAGYALAVECLRESKTSYGGKTGREPRTLHDWEQAADFLEAEARE